MSEFKQLLRAGEFHEAMASLAGSTNRSKINIVQRALEESLYLNEADLEELERQLAKRRDR